MNILPKLDKVFSNFFSCSNWEEKYLYLIDLGNKLLPFPHKMKNINNLINGCQSKVWIKVLFSHSDQKVKLYGDSEAAIVKGLIALVFIIYQDMTCIEITKYEVNSIFTKLDLNSYLTASRSQGLNAIIRSIKLQALKYTKLLNL